MACQRLWVSSRTTSEAARTVAAAPRSWAPMAAVIPKIIPNPASVLM
jgi:hypothetical protein